MTKKEIEQEEQWFKRNDIDVDFEGERPKHLKDSAESALERWELDYHELDPERDIESMKVIYEGNGHYTTEIHMKFMVDYGDHWGDEEGDDRKQKS